MVTSCLHFRVVVISDINISIQIQCEVRSNMGMVKVRRNLVGMVFGRLTVLSQAADHVKPNGKRRAKWLCQCSCGSEPKSIEQANLFYGNVQSCGCLKFDIEHGLCKSKTYKSWAGMFDRCNNPKDHGYHNYGGRGITVCVRWKKFENFLEDMGECPEGLSLDRINVNGNYEPSNCRWTNRSEQAYNQRIQKSNKSGKTGVHWCAARGLWIAQISKLGIQMYLGAFDNLDQAIEVRKLAELEMYGYNKD